MTAPTSIQPLLPSVLDRLIDHEPDVTSESNVQRLQTLREIKEAVRRDLEWLLNTRHSRHDLWDTSTEIATSCLTFGLPDFAAWAVSGSELRQRLQATVRQTVERFEPRLKGLEIVVHDPSDENGHLLQISIRGVLHVEPFEDTVAYNSVVESPLSFCDVRTA